MAEEEKKGCHETYKKLVEQRDLYAQKRTALCTAVKEHDGPFCSSEEVEVFVNEFSGLDEDLRKVISLEIKFQKIIINNRAIDSDLYKIKRKDHKIGKFVNVSLPDMIKNLKEMLMPLPEAVPFQTANLNDIVLKLEALHDEIKENYRHRDAPYLSSAKGAVMNNEVTSEQPGINNDQDVTFMESVTYVTAFFVDEERDWYPGILTKVVRSNVCGTCISIKRKNKTYKEHENCYLIRFLEPTNDRHIFSMGENIQYHVNHSQLLTSPKLEYLELPDGQGCGYKVLNLNEIDASLRENDLYQVSKGV